MLDAKAKPLYDSFVLDPLLKIPAVCAIKPITYTLFGLASGLLVPFFLFWGAPIVALSFLILSGLFDTLDGALARKVGKTSEVGAALDITSDRIVEFGVVLGLFLFAPEQRGLACLMMLGSILFCVTTFLVVGVFSENQTEKSFYYSPGLIERAEAFLFFGTMMLFSHLFSYLAWSFVFLTTLTGLLRMRQFFFLKYSMPKIRKTKSRME